MGQVLCELQLELQNGSPCTIVVLGNSKGETERFIPKTPASKETKRNKVSTRISHFQQGETRSKKKKIEHLFDYVSLRNSPSIEIIEV